jgi:hypothetical protein
VASGSLLQSRSISRGVRSLNRWVRALVGSKERAGEAQKPPYLLFRFTTG